MPVYTIYRAINIINNKSYIGFDSKWPRRIKTHKEHFKKVNGIFYSAIKKYGWENFKWEVLYQSFDGPHTLNIMENYFINEYCTYIGFDDCNGYNLTLGGQGALGLIVSKETRDKIRQKLRGKKHSDEHRKKNSLAQKGKKLSQEQIDKSAKARTGLKRSDKFKQEQSQRAKSYGWKPPGINTENENYKELCQKVSKGVSKVWEQRRQAGTASGNYIWVTNGNKNMRIKSQQPIPDGWVRGRSMVRNPVTGTFIKKGDKNEQ